MLTVTVDSNVYISALGFGGTPMQVLQLAIDGDIHIATSEFIRGEVARVLRTKLSWDAGRVSAADGFIVALTVATAGQLLCTVDAVKDDPTDNRVLECALESGSRLVITGDRDLLCLSEFRGIRILTPRQFLTARAEGSAEHLA